MSVRLMIWMGLLSGANCCWGAVGGAEAIDVGDRKQLFIDHRFIETSRGIELTVNPPVKKEIVLRPDETEADGMFWISAVVEVDGEYLMYYGTRRSGRSSEKDPRPTILRLARSKDGLHWERARVGLFDIGRGVNNNIVTVGAWATVFLDPNETEGYRFWMLGHVRENKYWPESQGAQRSYPRGERRPGALYLCRSKDGIHWFRVRDPVFPFTGDTRNQGLFDPRINKYVCYLRSRPGGHGSRAVARGESAHLVGPWPFKPDPNRDKRRPEQYGWLMTELPIVMAKDESDPPSLGIYTPNVHIYPWSEDVYLAFPGAYRLRDGIASYGRDERGKPANEGPLQPALAVSRDGVSWRRFRTPYVGLGRIGEIDSGTIYMGVGMVRQGQEIWQYLSVSPHTHHGFGISLPGMDGGILRTVQRLDGFVSADAGPAGGDMTTPPIVFAGNRLQLNVDCSAIGEVWVEIQDARGKPLPGYSMEEAVSVDLNGVAQEVWWKQGPDVGPLAGRPIRLRLRMRSAKLYAFQFTKVSPDAE